MIHLACVWAAGQRHLLSTWGWWNWATA